jgi:hypothetical protein
VLVYEITVFFTYQPLREEREPCVSVFYHCQAEIAIFGIRLHVFFLMDLLILPV